ncbi:MAG: hypothetical protein ACLRHW_13380 [Coprobacillus cateniformis]
MQVFIHASVSVYEASGQYQLYVQTIQQDGIETFICNMKH